MTSFNPLHCGAVVAQHARREALALLAHVSIPFIAGQWSLTTSPSRAWPRCRVSIPFIAGQWSLLRAHAADLATWVRFQSPSLRGSGRSLYYRQRRIRYPPGFNPLHCGAVVARGEMTILSNPYLLGFNPLHCGAVVAPGRSRHGRRMAGVVSIPFIAGQWSL